MKARSLTSCQFRRSRPGRTAARWRRLQDKRCEARHPQKFTLSPGVQTWTGSACRSAATCSRAGRISADSRSRRICRGTQLNAFRGALDALCRSLPLLLLLGWLVLECTVRLLTTAAAPVPCNHSVQAGAQSHRGRFARCISCTRHAARPPLRPSLPRAPARARAVAERGAFLRSDHAAGSEMRVENQGKCLAAPAPAAGRRPPAAPAASRVARRSRRAPATCPRA